jgi:hypothetical protein
MLPRKGFFEVDVVANGLMGMWTDCGRVADDTASLRIDRQMGF